MKNCFVAFLLALVLVFASTSAHAQGGTQIVPTLDRNNYWTGLNVYDFGNLQFATTPPQCDPGQFMIGLDITLGPNCQANSTIANGDIVATSEPGTPDIGLQINNAYADSACSNGCRIVIPPGDYAASTPIVIATKGKNASVECSGTSTTLTWTPTSGTMFQFAANGAGTGNGWGSGIKYCNLVNATSGTTAVAVRFGVSSSDTTGRTAQGAYLDNVQITGFKYQFDLESQAWNITATHSQFLNAVTSQVYYNSSAVNSGENIVFMGDTFANSLGVWTPSGVSLGLGSAITNFVGSNFDNVEVEAGAGTVNLTNPYFENPDGPSSHTLRTTPWLDVLNAVSTITGLTAADDDSGTPATQPDITVEGTLTWIGGTIFGANPATATVVTSGGGHVWMGGDLDLSAAVPQIVNNSGLPYANVGRANPQFGSQAVQLINPVLAGASHWLDLQQSDGSVTYDTFLEQIETNDSTNPSGFDICSQFSSTFFCSVQIDKGGAHIGFHGAPDSAVNQHFYGSNKFDHITNGTGLQSVAATGCTITAGAIGNTCNTTVTLPVAQADTLYLVVCTANGGSGLWTVGNANTLTTTTFVVPSAALSTTATGGGTVVCTITHQ